jgi:hypothetical protein
VPTWPRQKQTIAATCLMENLRFPSERVEANTGE